MIGGLQKFLDASPDERTKRNKRENAKGNLVNEGTEQMDVWEGERGSNIREQVRDIWWW